PFFVPMMMPNAAAGMISIRFGFTGPALCLSTACAAGANAIGEGVRMVRDGSAEVVVAGATEAPVTPLTVSAFARMGAMSGRNDEPELASRPCDAARDGFVIAEGSGFTVLETLERALARGARIHGEVLGYGRNADAHHITAPVPGGAGAAACMQLALDDAGLDAGAIGHVNAHGTSTPLNDATEAEAIRKVFGDITPPVTSTKGVTGHMIAGARAAEAVISPLQLRDWRRRGRRGGRDQPPVAARRHRAPHRQPRADRRRHRPRRGRGRAPSGRTQAGPVELVRLRRPQRPPDPRVGRRRRRLTTGRAAGDP